jgi:CBS domain containing-hemolysin-like protein
VDPDEWLLSAVILIALCVGGIALFSASESAFASMRRSRVTHLVEEGNARAAAVERLMEHPERFHIALRLATAMLTGLALGLSIAAGVLAAFSLTGDGAARRGMLLALPFVIAAGLLALPLVQLLGLALPRALAATRAERISLSWVGWWRALTGALSPLVWLNQSAGRYFARMLGVPRHAPARMASSEEEIKSIVEGSAEQGLLQDEEKEMIQSIFDFADTVVRKVMVPRIDMTCLAADTPIDQALAVILEEGHSRIPVYEDTVDTIVGIVHAKDLLQPLMVGGGARPLREVMRPPFFVPEGKKVGELLHEFKRSKNQLAIVVDEYGGTSGLVTIEDLLEEIVGDIQDEYDVEEPDVVILDERTCILDARLPLEDVGDRLGIELPTEEYDTLGGLVFGLLGRLPSEGDVVVYGPLDLVVEQTDGHRIQKVRAARVEREALAPGQETSLEA